MPRNGNQDGYTLMETVMVIVIIGILATLAFRAIGTTIDTVRAEETMAEMERLAYAIAGNANLISNGSRSDFGYIGDVGALPPGWDALVTNPGYATWDGPYISDDFSAGAGDYEFKLDSWGKPYSSPAGNTFSSTGGPRVITRAIANSVSDLLYNRVLIFVEDIDHSPPGPAFADSVRLVLTYPDGAGGLTARAVYPSANGLTQFDSIPIGLHRLRMIYLPQNDTIQRQVAINPGQPAHIDLQYFGDVW